MKNIAILLLPLIVASCYQPSEEVNQEKEQEIESNDEIIITSIVSDLECHMCPGYILVQKGDRLDSIESGIWGKPGTYIPFKKDERNFIAFPGGYIAGGVSEYSLRIISLNDDDYLETVFDTLVSDSYRGRRGYLEMLRISFDFIPPDTLAFDSYTEMYDHADESSEIIDSSSFVHIINLNR